MVHELKYSDMTSLGVELGRKVGERLHETLKSVKVDGLVPVPLHKIKQRERGYNQTEYICRGIESVTGVPVFPGLLQRTRYTESQTNLDIDQRRHNVAEAFCAKPTSRTDIPGKRWVIVDDVITTGATIAECARVLRTYGASGVIACSAALAP